MESHLSMDFTVNCHIIKLSSIWYIRAFHTEMSIYCSWNTNMEDILLFSSIVWTHQESTIRGISMGSSY